MNDKNIIGGVVTLLLVVGGVLFVMSSDSKKVAIENAPTGASQLAQCLKDSGTTFYGAFWCPHCKKQKELFGSAVTLLPYVECSNPDGNGQTPICKEKGITGYPTWIFKDGSQLSGEQTFAALAAKSGCADPSKGALPATSTSPNASPVPPGSFPRGI